MARKKNEVADAPGQIFIRTGWTLKKGTEIPEELDGVELQVQRLALTDDPAEALRRVLITAGADEDVTVSIDGEVSKEVAHAVVDNWNQPLALNRQKAAKDTIKDAVKSRTDEDRETIPLPTPDELQATLDEFTMVPNQRRLGGGSKKERETLGKKVQDLRANAATMDEDEKAILAKYGLLG